MMVLGETHLQRTLNAYANYHIMLGYSIRKGQGAEIRADLAHAALARTAITGAKLRRRRVACVGEFSVVRRERS